MFFKSVGRFHFNIVFLAGLFVALVTAGTKMPSARLTYDRPVPASFFGMHIHHAGGATPWPEVPFAEWRLWDAGVAWPSIEPRRGQWQFAELDRYVDLAQHAGVGLLLPLGLSPGWASARLRLGRMEAQASCLTGSIHRLSRRCSFRS